MKLALIACLTAALLPAQPAGVIEGRITNLVTGEPVAGVEIRFLDSHSYVLKTTSDASGTYRLTGLADGRYSGEFAKEGFQDSRANSSVQVSGTIAGRQDIQLQPWSSLRGRVLDEDGNPVPQIPVLLGSRDSTTDDNGAFLFTSLPPGSYPLLAKPQPAVRVVSGVRLGAVPIYYPSVTNLSEAVLVAIGKGADVSGIDIRLRSVPVHRLSGIVLDAAGKPAAKATVKLLGPGSPLRQSLGTFLTVTGESPAHVLTLAGPASEPELARVDTNADGTFEFPAVEPGDWRLLATLGEMDEAPLAAIASAFVSEADAEKIQLRLTPQFSLGVNAQWPDRTPPALITQNARFGLMLIPAESQPRVFGDPEKGIGQLNGLFPGRYRVLPANFPVGYAVSAVLWGGRDVLGQIVELVPGAPPVEVVYSTRIGSLHGTIANGGECSVILTPRNQAEFTTIRSEPCHANGVFDFANIPEGDYYAVAFDHADDRTLPVAEIPGAILPIATSVHIESGSTASLELRLNRWPW